MQGLLCIGFAGPARCPARLHQLRTQFVHLFRGVFLHDGIRLAWTGECFAKLPNSEACGMEFMKARGRGGKRRASVGPKLVLAAALALGLGGCLGYDGQVVHGYQLDPKTAEDVKVGSSAEHVLVLLGSPTTTSTVGGDAWYYISQVTDRGLSFMPPKVTDQRVFAVYFTKDKKVARVANYGMEDGKLIDFVSRTTPTAGAESTFLKGMFINLLHF
jgi:outer membrane protein assembly factor BamE (lipoprotein component of BamABCDE complex)